MSDTQLATGILTQRLRTYDLKRRGLEDWYNKRSDEGQKKYGRGRQNAGYRRDNLLDVLEEVSDAFEIMGFFLARIGKAADATSSIDIHQIDTAISISNDLLWLFDRIDKLREWVDDTNPVLLKETVTRLVPLNPQPTSRSN